ncbi:hypothetical protein [Caballeronia sp. DA-9]|uniref:hypothetical protein n=1 Tax=Caballeronia sp. DA-9 TaxID=3436237 RepID=UPI003F681343
MAVRDISPGGPMLCAQAGCRERARMRLTVSCMGLPRDFRRFFACGWRLSSRQCL